MFDYQQFELFKKMYSVQEMHRLQSCRCCWLHNMWHSYSQCSPHSFPQLDSNNVYYRRRRRRLGEVNNLPPILLQCCRFVDDGKNIFSSPFFSIIKFYLFSLAKEIPKIKPVSTEMKEKKKKDFSSRLFFARSRRNNTHDSILIYSQTRTYTVAICLLEISLIFF